MKFYKHKSFVNSHQYFITLKLTPSKQVFDVFENKLNCKTREYNLPDCLDQVFSVFLRISASNF